MGIFTGLAKITLAKKAWDSVPELATQPLTAMCSGMCRSNGRRIASESGVGDLGHELHSFVFGEAGQTRDVDGHLLTL